MRIQSSPISYEVSKALGEVQGSAFQLEDITEAVNLVQAKPGLLTALLGGAINDRLLMTDTFKWDEESDSAALPDGKAYSAYGKEIQKDVPRQLRYAVPSFGIKFSVAPGDYAGRRKPGTNEFLTEEDVVAKMNVKAAQAWANFDELAIAQLITTDTNIVRGGPFAVYNYHTEIAGGARAAATDMDLGSTTLDFYQTFREQRRLLQQELERNMDSASQIVVVCGDAFFDDRYAIEQREGLAREIKFGLDLATQPINETGFGSGNYNYAWFDSMDGLRYINYGSEIIAGSPLIGANNAYMIPVGAQNLMCMAYAPAQTREYVNQEAQRMYAWSNITSRQGVTVWQESNKLPVLMSPTCVRWLTTTTHP